MNAGAEGYNVPDIVCDIYFDGKHPCLGGVLALDGRSGETLWRYNAEHEIFSVNCNIDLTGDGVEDCLVAGRVGVCNIFLIISYLHAKKTLNIVM